MRRTVSIFVAAVVLSLQLYGQTAQDYKKRYELLVSKLGPSGVGIENVIDRWAALDSLDVDMLKARHSYYFSKCQRTEILRKDARKFLGAEPVLTLKDSLGNKVNYFQETFYDDSLYRIAASSIDKAIKVAPERLDLRIDKATSLTKYEKDSPDMAVSFLSNLADEDKAMDGEWEYPGVEVNDTLFCDLMQEYCYAYFLIGTPSSLDAFRRLSEKMSSLYPSNIHFLDDLGSYYLVTEDYKTSLKYFKKVLKIKPDDYTAIRNCVTLGMKKKDVKMQKKYLPLLLEYGNESDKLAAKARLEALGK